MADVNTIAKQFVDYYYSTFSSGRQGLAPLYVSTRDSSLSGSSAYDLRPCSAIRRCSPGKASPSRAWAPLLRSSLCVRAARYQQVGSPCGMQTLPFEKVAHRVTTLDAQPSSPSQPSMIVLVTGLLIVRIHPRSLISTRSHAACVRRSTTARTRSTSARPSSCSRRAARTLCASPSAVHVRADARSR